MITSVSLKYPWFFLLLWFTVFFAIWLLSFPPAIGASLGGVESTHVSRLLPSWSFTSWFVFPLLGDHLLNMLAQIIPDSEEMLLSYGCCRSSSPASHSCASCKIALRRASATCFVLDLFRFTWLLPQAVLLEARECLACLQSQSIVGVQLMLAARKNELAKGLFTLHPGISSILTWRKGQTLFLLSLRLMLYFTFLNPHLGTLNSALISCSLTVESLDSVKFHVWLFITLMVQEALTAQTLMLRVIYSGHLGNELHSE